MHKRKVQSFLRSETLDGILEEIPEAYKDIDAVIDVVHRAGLARRVARLRPLAVIKG
jgi:tRNA-splicing ligase RtcB